MFKFISDEQLLFEVTINDLQDISSKYIRLPLRRDWRIAETTSLPVRLWTWKSKKFK
jgi:hypothetical protein